MNRPRYCLITPCRDEERYARRTLESIAAQTVTPVHLYDVRINAGHAVVLPARDGFTTAVVMQRGTVRLNEAEPATAGDFALFERTGEDVRVASEHEDVRLLFLSGEPIDEPVVGQGPFVMNTRDEIRQAMVDYQSGKMGSLS